MTIEFQGSDDRVRFGTQARLLAPGIVLSFVVAAAATFLSEHYGAPVMLFALLLGMALHFLSADARAAPGIDFTARKLLRVGIALLGARITFAQMAELGAAPVLLVGVSGGRAVAILPLGPAWWGGKGPLAVKLSLVPSVRWVKLTSAACRSRRHERDPLGGPKGRQREPLAGNAGDAQAEDGHGRCAGERDGPDDLDADDKNKITEWRHPGPERVTARHGRKAQGERSTRSRRQGLRSSRWGSSVPGLERMQLSELM